jgi:hypothetical protein
MQAEMVACGLFKLPTSIGGRRTWLRPETRTPTAGAVQGKNAWAFILHLQCIFRLKPDLNGVGTFQLQ